MAASPTIDLIINVKDRNKKGLLALVDGQVSSGTTKLPLFVRNDGEYLTLRFVKPSSSGVRQWDDIDVSGASVRVSVGLPDQSPTAGTFFIQVGASSTPDLPWNATPAVVEAALNLLSDIISAGGVTVDSSYRVTWDVAGTQGSIPATLLRSPTVRLYLLPDVTGYTGGGIHNLDGTITIGTALNSIFKAVIAGAGSDWRLQAGTAVTDVSAGIIRTTDYDAVLNAVNLVRVGGL